MAVSDGVTGMSRKALAGSTRLVSCGASSVSRPGATERDAAADDNHIRACIVGVHHAEPIGELGACGRVPSDHGDVGEAEAAEPEDGGAGHPTAAEHDRVGGLNTGERPGNAVDIGTGA